MAGPPSPKRQRTDDGPAPASTATATPDLAKLQASLDLISKVEEEIGEHDLEMALEIRKIESKHGAKMRALYEKRSPLLGAIPSFWKQVLSNDPMIGATLSEHEDKLLEFVEKLDVTYIDEEGGYKIELTFKENPYLKSTAVWRQVTFNEKSEPSATASTLEWKDSEEAKEAEEGASFFAWFTAPDGDDDLADHIKDDIWKNPMQYYLENDDEEEGEDEDEDEGEDDDEEEEAEAEGEEETK